MKNVFANYLLIAMLFSAAGIVGCINLPSPSHPAANAQNSGTASATSASAVPRVNPDSTASVEIQKTVNWLAVLCTLGGVALLALCGLCAYGGQILSAVKFGIAGILLPIFGIWFAFHWLAVTIAVLVGAGGFFLATHIPLVAARVSQIETEIATLKNSIK